MRYPTEIFLQRSLRALSIACLLLCALPAFSQSVSATLRGQVTSDSQPAGGATVTATNTRTGFSRSVHAADNGSYSLAGLPPGSYKIEVTAAGQSTSQLVALQVGQTATLDLSVGNAPAETLESVTVSATRLVETKTSEVASYVSLKQIEVLPQSSRNFLEFADTIPGVQFVQSSNGSTEIRSGAQAANGVNVFIDGIGQKNYVLRGGVGGQGSLSDSPASSRGTRGNPFPQLAIGEYKVITSNYKAEYDQLSSAAIVAATKSGTNEFEVDAFWDRTDERWRAADPFEARAGTKTQSQQEQYGAAIGGPIIRDRMHFFMTYESKRFESPSRVFPGQGITLLPSQYQDYLGSFAEPFKEDLAFAKVDWTPGDAHLLALSVKLRDESEETFGDNEAPGHGTVKENRDARYHFRYQYTGAFFLNDAHLTYEDGSFSPRPSNNGIGMQLTDTPIASREVLKFGAGDSYEDRGQQGYGLQDDLSFDPVEWFGTHALKTGIKYKKIELNVQSQTPYNPQFSIDMNDPTQTPWRVRFGAPLPVIDDLNVVSRNEQYGLYVQDDWDVSNRLQLNLGLRYDYERTPSYLNYVTPPDILAAFNTQDTNPGGNGHPPAPPGQTYAQTLALAGVDISNFISTGNNRKAFDRAIQPRLGFSFDLQDDQRHVVFGGFGRAYDRNVFEYLARETFKGTYPTYTRFFDSPTSPCTPGAAQCLAWDPAYYDQENLLALVAANPSLGREFFMLNNGLRTPHSDQFSLGMRNRMNFLGQDWTTSATLSYVEAKDGIVFLLGNRWPDGTFRRAGTTWEGQPWGSGIPGYGTFILGSNGLASRAKSLLLSAEKPYSSESGWATTLAYTYTSARENRSNIASEDDTYLFDYPSIDGYGWHASTGVPRHRLVATGIYDAPWEFTLSAKLTLASPMYLQAYNCRDVPDRQHCYPDPAKPDTTFGFKQLDLAMQKQFGFASDFEFNVRADILNVFNSANVDKRNDNRGDPGVPNPRFLEPTQYLQPTRTFKLSLSTSWR